MTASGNSKAARNRSGACVPALGNPADGFESWTLFAPRKHNHFCPMGQQCDENIVNPDARRLISHFDPARCRECPHSS
jgi:hypothetical protein